MRTVIIPWLAKHKEKILNNTLLLHQKSKP